MTGFWTYIRRNHDDILIRGYDREGKPFAEREWFSPSSYEPDANGDHIGLDGTRVQRYCHANSSLAGAWRKKKVGGPVYGDVPVIHEYLAHHYPDPVEWNPALIRCAFMDIEVDIPSMTDSTVEDASHRITIITMRDWRDGQPYRSWGTIDFTPGDGITYEKHISETAMLASFLDHWARRPPDFLSGWYLDHFDLPYLVNRIRRLLGPKAVSRLSPFGRVQTETLRSSYGEATTYDIVGVTVLDGLRLFKKFGVTRFGGQESYSLDHIANVVLGVGKIDHGGSLSRLLRENPQKYGEYNIRDVSLLVDMERTVGLLKIALELTYLARCRHVEAFGTVGIWEAIAYNRLKTAGYIMPPRKDRPAREDLKGAYVKDPMLGRHRWVVSYDFASLYPSLMIAFNLSPETVVDNERISVPDIDEQIDMIHKSDKETWHNHPKWSVTARGNIFRNDLDGFIPKTVSDFFALRKSIKKEMHEVRARIEAEGDSPEMRAKRMTLDARQMSLKILLNSLYGAMSNVHFRFYDIRIAESITLTGQLLVKYAERVVNRYLNKVCKTDRDWVIAMDTDSLYIGMEPVVDRFMSGMTDRQIVDGLDRLCKERLDNLFQREITAFLRRMGAKNPDALDLEREKICDVAIWTSGKKRYALRVVDDEGVRLAKPKIEVRGIESRRSSTPAVVRDVLQQAIERGFSCGETEMRRWVKEQKQWFLGMSPEEVAFPRTASDVEKYQEENGRYRSGTPIHVRAAILYNHWLDKQNLDEYERVRDGGKLRFVYLKTPNPVGENVMGFIDRLPPEFELHEYIDMETQCEKAMIGPIRNLFSSIGWRIDTVESLEDLL